MNLRRRRNPTSEERKRRKDAGLCPECGNEIDQESKEASKKTCAKCLVRRKASAAKKAIGGVCRCGRKIKTAKSRCEICCAKIRADSKKRRAKTRPCPSCGKPMEKYQIKFCKSCAKDSEKKDVKKRAKKRANDGRCKNCGRKKKEKDKDFAWCSKCRDSNNLRRKIDRFKANRGLGKVAKGRHHRKKIPKQTPSKDEEE